MPPVFILQPGSFKGLGDEKQEGEQVAGKTAGSANKKQYGSLRAFFKLATNFWAPRAIRNLSFQENI